MSRVSPLSLRSVSVDTALQKDLELAGDLVREAGRLAARMRAAADDGALEREQKTSVADVVTAADRAAEEYVADQLAAARPADGVIGEEGAARDGDRTWVIDPVDGTYNFVSGLTWWCSALALTGASQELLLGAVYHPHDDALFLGGPSIPTTRNGVVLPRIEDVPLSHACVTTYMSAGGYATEPGRALARAIGGAAAVRMLGSGSMDLTAIAQGQLHVYVQRAVPAWDRLPGEALVLGAGGASRQVEAAGATWTVIGTPSAVDSVAEALSAGS